MNDSGAALAQPRVVDRERANPVAVGGVAGRVRSRSAVGISAPSRPKDSFVQGGLVNKVNLPSFGALVAQLGQGGEGSG